MSEKLIYYLAAGVGGTLGGLVPNLWQGGILSLWSILFSTIGGIGGVWIAYRQVHS